jgi:hypothetical protein
MVKMYTFIFALLLSLVISDNTGSIFSTIKDPNIQTVDPSDDDTDSTEDSSGKPIETSSSQDQADDDFVTQRPVQVSAYEVSPVPIGDTVKSQPSAESNETAQASSPATETYDPAQQLMSENQELAQSNEQLEQQLSQVLSLLNTYRLKEVQRLEYYSQEMEKLSDYNIDVNYVLQNYQTPNTTDAAVTANYTYANDTSNSTLSVFMNSNSSYNEMEISLAMVCILGLGFIFLFFHKLKGIWLLYSGSELNQGIYTLLVDSTILALLWCLVAVLRWFNAFNLELFKILLGLVFFTFFWVAIGLWLVFVSYLQIQKWKKFENLCVIPGEKSRDLNIYLIMRLLFISPIYTATVTEAYLRPNFNFAGYLSRSVGDTIHKYFHINWIGYSIVIGILIIWRYGIRNDELYEIIILWAYPGVAFVFSSLILFKLYRVYNKLVPDTLIQQIEASTIKYQSSDELRRCIPKPKYLKGKIDESVLRTCFCCKVHPFKMTCAYLFLSRFPNRHELLFWFDSYGPTLIGIIVQVQIIVQAFWLAATIMYYIPKFIDKANQASSIIGPPLVVLASLIWAFTSFYIIPKIFIYLSIITKIELMKDRKIIEDVISDTRNSMTLRTIKIYRQLKMIYREIKGRQEGEEKGQLLHYMKKISEEVFLLVSNNRKTIHVVDLDEVMNLIGVRLDEDELRLFAKECSPDRNNLITLKNFKIAAERILYGFELNSHEVVRAILKEYFSKKPKITINDLNELFNEWSWHFADEDLREFLIETQTLADPSGYIRHEEVANMIRITVEACPK